MNPVEGAVVLFSGGQDSTTCLAWAVKQWGTENVLALSFAYGQRHEVELQSARAICKLLGVKRLELGVDFLPTSAMTSRTIPVDTDGGVHGLPSTFVPGRNAVFISMAAGVAVASGWFNVVTGVCQTDFSGYPDCREGFVSALEAALRLGLDTKNLAVHTPLMHLTKADTVRLAQELGAMNVLALSHTCYEGVSGGGCGKCPSCLLRKKGFKEAGIPDPAVVVVLDAEH